MEMENLIINSVDDVLYEEAKSVWWDNLKIDIKKRSIEHSKKMQRIKKRNERLLNKEWEEEIKKVAEGRMDGNRIVILEEQLKKIEEAKCMGAKIRSRAKNTVEKERSTKFFYDLEKTRKQAEIIKSISKNGKVVKGKEGILYEVIFYLKRSNK